MSPFFTLAADFIERMANPSFGRQINEDYAARFLTLREKGQKNIPQMVEEAQKIDDVSTFSVHGWNWMLSWCLSDQKRYLSEKLLLDLIFEWQNVAFMAKIIEVATLGKELDNTLTLTMRNFPEPWIRQLFDEAFFPGVVNSERYYSRRISLSNSFLLSLFDALVQVGSEITLAAGSIVLNDNYQWPGMQELRQQLTARLERFDPESKRLWISRFQL